MLHSSLFRHQRRIHLVDRSLLIIMLVLLLQSTVSLFLHGTAQQTVTSVDVVIRTASAAIFGYLLGGNFGKESFAGGQTQTAAPVHILEEDAQSEPTTPGMRARIGFADDSEPPATSLTTAPATVSGDEVSTGAGIQVFVAAAIGLFCLIVLLILRNLTDLGVITELSDSATATVIQFRDYVSGCVGFLIGSPTNASNSNS